ncbi:CPn0927/CPn0928 family alpha/beta hydrolase fold protein [Estrella lausannensis]|uniref:Conserved putative membrane protein n=1 Tax=Estrella lausannensis TaxID=483423 RepID=A0A0H5DRY0_9BACT|nr:CPn0927/CPn0928 family alpha/beta hydrolase fold protein [Estrella lausannensis]CRX39392.1 Conserved putative membrane protein [Estrella lausannensis]
MAIQPAISSLLTGQKAFYHQPDYGMRTFGELSCLEALPPCYCVSIESRISRIAKVVLAIVFFPLGIWYLLHRVAGLFLVPASFDPEITKISIAAREALNLEGPWKYKRFTVAVDDCLVDACVIGREETLGNGRFVLKSFGNGETYRLSDYAFEQFLQEINGNAIVFNVPGVGGSVGGPSRDTMAKAYRAMLQFMEDQEEGLGAREIIGYGYSIGGAVQATGLDEHTLRNDLKYLFIKDKTFATLGGIATDIAGGFIGFVVKALGWNISVVDSSIRLKAKEIIIQTTSGYQERVLTSAAEIINDGIITASASLAKAILESKEPMYEKVVIATPTDHGTPLLSTNILSTEVNRMLGEV